MTAGVGNVFTVTGKLPLMIPVLRQGHLSLGACPSLHFQIMVTFQTVTDKEDTNSRTFSLPAPPHTLFLPNEAPLVLHTRSNTPRRYSHSTRSPCCSCDQGCLLRSSCIFDWSTTATPAFPCQQVAQFRYSPSEIVPRWAWKKITVTPEACHKPRSLETVYCVIFPYSYTPPSTSPLIFHVAASCLFLLKQRWFAMPP